VGVQGIEAEIPQDLHEQIRGIGAESPAGRNFASQNCCSPMRPGFLARKRQKCTQILKLK
jgi:hypothetical protein